MTTLIAYALLAMLFITAGVTAWQAVQINSLRKIVDTLLCDIHSQECITKYRMNRTFTETAGEVTLEEIAKLVIDGEPIMRNEETQAFPLKK